MSLDTASAHQPNPSAAVNPRPSPAARGRAPAGGWRALAAAVALAAAACGGSQAPQPPSTTVTAQPSAGAEPVATEPVATEPVATERDPAQVTEELLAEIAAAEAREEPAPAVEPVFEVAGCDDDAAGDEPVAGGEPVVELCFVAFGDASFDGSGPDELIEGVRIVALARWRDDHDLWWKSFYGPAWAMSGGREVFWVHDLSRAGYNVKPDHGQQVRAAPESIAAAAAAVASVVTGSEGTALASIQTTENYQFCAVHPDDSGLIAGCSNFDRPPPQYRPQGLRFGPSSLIDRAVTEQGGNLYFRKPPPTRLPVFVYFSRGRAFFVDSGRYGRFLTGDIHPPGTGNVTVAGFNPHVNQDHTRILVPFGQGSGAVAAVKDEDIGEFWDAVNEGWFQQIDYESPLTWAPATLLITGADGTVTTELAAGDYLFCRMLFFGKSDCIYEDVTAGQDRILEPWSIEGMHYLGEHTESGSALLFEAIATCGTNPRRPCVTREQYTRARQHYRDTGEYPEGWWASTPKAGD